MTKLDLTALAAISGGGATSANSANNGGIAIQGDNNVVYACNQSSNGGSSRKS